MSQYLVADATSAIWLETRSDPLSWSGMTDESLRYAFEPVLIYVQYYTEYCNAEEKDIEL